MLSIDKLNSIKYVEQNTKKPSEPRTRKTPVPADAVATSAMIRPPMKPAVLSSAAIDGGATAVADGGGFCSISGTAASTSSSAFVGVALMIDGSPLTVFHSAASRKGAPSLAHFSSRRNPQPIDHR